MKARPLLRVLARAALVTGVCGWLTSVAPAGEDDTAGETIHLAVIVHPDNSIKGLRSSELRSYFKLERRYWTSGRRTNLILRSSRSIETRILLEQVYKMSPSELRKFWHGKVFRGEITRRPSTVSRTADVCKKVKRDPSAFSVVLASEVPEGVRVLTIDGKQPGQEGYLLRVSIPDESGAPPRPF